MSEQAIRPYSLLIYGLQDDFIGTLKPMSLESKGHIINPKMVLKNDGTQELTLSIPMYYSEPTTGLRTINPLWAKTRGQELIADLRKIKVVLGSQLNEEKVFEFVIISKKDKHSGGTLECEIKCEGLAYRELGGTGYKLSLTQDDFLAEYDSWLYNTDANKGPEPVMSINYWCDKVFDGSTAWDYRIEMNWNAYNDTWQSNKIYEDEYVSDWNVDNTGILTPNAIEKGREKYRAIDCRESNRYNITQSIAEAFGVYCRYEYNYDDNYHITGRTAVFYNNYFQDTEDKTLDIIYPYQLNEVIREIEGTDIVTKMYVKDIEDPDQVSGIISIGDAKANKSGEDYILNFDYLKAVGSITEEQYNAIAPFEAAMHNYNQQINKYGAKIAAYQVDLTNYQAELANANEALKQAEERIKEAELGKLSLLGVKGTLRIGGENGEYSISSKSSIATTNIKDGPAIDSANGYVLRAKAPVEGPIASTIKLYHPPKMSEDAELIPESQYQLIYDTTYSNIVIAVDFKETAFTDYISHMVFWSCEYIPTLKYDLIIDEYSLNRAQQEQEFGRLDSIIKGLQADLNAADSSLASLIQEKEKKQKEFSRLMGSALREGGWQDDGYKDYGRKQKLDGIFSPSAADVVWDAEKFDGEQIEYEEVGVNKDKRYYDYIILTNNMLNLYKDKLDKISLCYDIHYSERRPNGEILEQSRVLTLPVGADMFYGFINRQPALIINNPIDLSILGSVVDGTLTINKFLAVVSHEVVKNVQTGLYEYNASYSDRTNNINIVAGGASLYYPRIRFTDDTLKTASDKFSVQLGEEILTKYVDYSLLQRTTGSNTGWMLTIRPEAILQFGSAWNTTKFMVTYELSNACTSLYLDALEVMKTNCAPQVSYTLTLSKVPEHILQHLYNYLSCIVNITDPELFFDEVRGYISEIEMSLDAPWEDKITTKDYKTKFEDLFSSIVATTEQMKSNGAVLNAAAAAFSASSSSLINESTLQHSINHYNLSQQFDQGALTMTNDRGIWAVSDEGVVAMTGGGIFCATQKDSMGQWQWHTGLTPVGINASLITTGHLDTNLIHIYSDDNVALQLDKNGLFAYKQTQLDTGETQYLPDTYVVHNENGLFFNDKGINRVEISWDGLKIRNNIGDEVFYVNEEGNLVLDKAVINNAIISDAIIGDLRQDLNTGLNYISMSGSEFKWDKNLNSYQPNTLSWAIVALRVKPEPNNAEAFNVSYGYTPITEADLMPEGSNWKYNTAGKDTWQQLTTEELLTGNLIKIDNNHLTMQVKSSLMANHDICYVRVATVCAKNSNPEEKIYSDEIFTIIAMRDGEDGTSPVNCEIISSIGNIIKNGQTENFSLTARIFRGTEELDPDGLDSHFIYHWASSTDTSFNRTGKTLTGLSKNDINNITTFTCTIETV